MKGNVPTGGFDFKAKTRSKSTGHYNQGVSCDTFYIFTNFKVF